MAHQGHRVDDDDEDQDAAPPPIVPISSAAEHADDGRRGGRSRHDHSKREKQIKFGDYILGNTIGEGEFGKVKLGWKQEGGVQVAIKLIKKDALGNNPTRMAKIMREVNILRQLNHPNIVQLHKMEESEHHYGIVLEYASGGELFDYILNHRYLKDNAARRLFAQLISGVGYLHKKGIVHRDLKLENLLLDRNRNIIITDFGFANTFDPTEELTEDEEINLADRDWVKRMGFDRVKANGMRKADLMQTSCGSPCYAAPELVVSDSLYTGRKVDVWSCGVILYAMLAGYLPFDDDPKNPEGDNINLLYKYIVNTPLTFPEYVTPHARDLLRRILVPNPRQRADLFEVARHSWLSEYANVIEFITSSTTSSADIQNLSAAAEDPDGSLLARSASVREASKKAMVSPTVGGLSSKAGNIDSDGEAAVLKQQKDNKRRTVQVEYVAPTSRTQRGEVQANSPGQASLPTAAGRTRARPISQGPVAVMASSLASPTDKPLPRDPPVSKDAYMKPQRESRRPPSAHRTTGTAAAVTAASTGAGPARVGRDGRVVSEAAYMASMPGGRPITGGSMASTGSHATPNRASFGQPVPPTVAGTNAHGRIQQPSGNGGRNSYAMSNSAAQDTSSAFGRPSISVPSKFAEVSGFSGGEGGSASNGLGHGGGDGKGHRRSNTLGEITDKLLGRSGSIFGGKNRKKPDQQQQRQSVAAEKPSRRYPPVSMANSATIQNIVGGDEPRTSMDSTARQSRRSFSLGLGKKRSGSIEGSQTSQEKQHNRRFSLLPGSFSLKSIGIHRDYDTGPESQLDLPIQEPPADGQPSNGRQVDEGMEPGYDGMYTYLTDNSQQSNAVGTANAGFGSPQQAPSQRTQQQQQQPQYQPNQQQQQQQQQQQPPTQHHRYASGSNFERQRPSALQEVTDNVQRNPPPRSAPYQADADADGMQAQDLRRANNSRGGRVVLQKNKRMVDAYDTDEFAKHHDRSGSSGAARRVMDFFRRRSKARGGED
ncbi:Serine/threonine-protein kinase KIN4 [Niveomyces insectorum RCEF 264]|uniref:non-specific serine/threonine protein kinase n=1 Tax=Niveomyces insectorum RCEF 264 TaxID=1081102 RepID=A0A167NAC1_9HYPO|nr:Serine/threonine-protein kinase KIN4 [Niveomyces insectorum RCEF 264]